MFGSETKAYLRIYIMTLQNIGAEEHVGFMPRVSGCNCGFKWTKRKLSWPCGTTQSQVGPRTMMSLGPFSVLMGLTVCGLHANSCTQTHRQTHRQTKLFLKNYLTFFCAFQVYQMIAFLLGMHKMQYLLQTYLLWSHRAHFHRLWRRKKQKHTIYKHNNWKRNPRKRPRKRNEKKNQ